MIVTQIANVVERLSDYWTHQRVVSTAMHLAGITDNEVVQLDTIRHYVNLGVSHIAELLRVANSPFYGVKLDAIFDRPDHLTTRPNGPDFDIKKDAGLFKITLTTGADWQTAARDHWYRHLATIDRISIFGTAAVGNVPAYQGNAIRKDIAELTHLVSQENTQSRHSIFWSHQGNTIYFYVGNRIGVEDQLGSAAESASDSGAAISNANNNFDYAIADPSTTPTADNSVETAGPIDIWGQRKPLLDNLTQAPNTAGGTYVNNVDLPDEHIELLVKMTQKRLLEHRREAVPQALDQEIQSATMLIRRQLDDELRFEQAERQKQDYGSQQKAPGVV
tara:strand:+ start:2568 stop:3569 length:1002 start_codon:yes stop_codon:yes gene_type:complete